MVGGIPNIKMFSSGKPIFLAIRQYACKKLAWSAVQYAARFQNSKKRREKFATIV